MAFPRDGVGGPRNHILGLRRADGKPAFGVGGFHHFATVPEDHWGRVASRQGHLRGVLDLCQTVGTKRVAQPVDLPFPTSGGGCRSEAHRHIQVFKDLDNVGAAVSNAAAVFLCRLREEMLRHVAERPGVTTVQFEAKVERDRVRLRLEHDGQRFESGAGAAPAGDGAVLSSIAERVRLIGGGGQWHVLVDPDPARARLSVEGTRHEGLGRLTPRCGRAGATVREQTAAKELAEHLRQIAGAPCAVRESAEASAVPERAISVCPALARRAAGLRALAHDFASG